MKMFSILIFLTLISYSQAQTCGAGPTTCSVCGATAAVTDFNFPEDGDALTVKVGTSVSKCSFTATTTNCITPTTAVFGISPTTSALTCTATTCTTNAPTSVVVGTPTPTPGHTVTSVSGGSSCIQSPTGNTCIAGTTGTYGQSPTASLVCTSTACTVKAPTTAIVQQSPTSFLSVTAPTVILQQNGLSALTLTASVAYLSNSAEAAMYIPTGAGAYIANAVTGLAATSTVGMTAGTPSIRLITSSPSPTVPVAVFNLGHLTPTPTPNPAVFTYALPIISGITGTASTLTAITPTTAILGVSPTQGLTCVNSPTPVGCKIQTPSPIQLTSNPSAPTTTTLTIGGNEISASIPSTGPSSIKLDVTGTGAGGFFVGTPNIYLGYSGPAPTTITTPTPSVSVTLGGSTSNVITQGVYFNNWGKFLARDTTFPTPTPTPVYLTIPFYSVSSPVPAPSPAPNLNLITASPSTVQLTLASCTPTPSYTFLGSDCFTLPVAAWYRFTYNIYFTGSTSYIMYLVLDNTGGGVSQCVHYTKTPSTSDIVSIGGVCSIKVPTSAPAPAPSPDTNRAYFVVNPGAVAISISTSLTNVVIEQWKPV